MTYPVPTFQETSMDLKLAHAFSSKHRTQVEQSDRCSCFHCLATFSPAEITEWVDHDSTALCPMCGVDAVIGSASLVPLTDSFLKLMQAEWF
jgi:hypothetical protein